MFARGDLLHERTDDRLGLFGIAGLEDGPRRPELVLSIKTAEPQRGLQELASQVLLAGKDQGDAISRLRLGDLGQLRGGDLQMMKRARPQLGQLRSWAATAASSPAISRAIPERSRSIDPAKRWPKPWNRGSGHSSKAWICGAALSNRPLSSTCASAISTATVCRPITAWVAVRRTACGDLSA